MHGQNMAFESGDVGPLLPGAGFIRPRIEAPVRVRTSSDRSPLLDAAFRSPAARAALRQTSAAGSTFLAYIFETFRFFLTRSVSSSRPRPAFLCPREARSPRVNPLPGPIPELSVCLSSRRSPPGFLDPSGSLRSSLDPTGKLTITSRPIFLRSPPRLNNKLTLSATDHRSRSATSRQARCPSNLLEPSPYCPESYSESSEKLIFPRKFTIAFSIA